MRTYVNDVSNSTYNQEMRFDELAQYSTANCLILHGCKDIPSEENGTEKVFENYVLKKLNTKMQLENLLVVMCCLLKKEKNPIIIKFVHRSVRNYIFANKTKLKANAGTDVDNGIKWIIYDMDNAKQAFHFKNVWTVKAKLYCKFEKHKYVINDFNDIEKIHFPARYHDY